jgi:SAM-dependent methyltransferase
MRPSDWTTARGEKWRAQLPGMESMLAPIDEPLIRALRLDAPYRIAEIGCGGGGTTLELVRCAPRGSIVHGLDISPSLIELARTRTPHDIFEVADMATAAPKQAYDRLISRFGVMFFNEARAAFSNLLRWLSPRGRFAFAVWGPPSENPWLTSVRDVVSRFVTIPRSDPNGPGPFRYADAGAFLALLEAVGFEQLEVREWRGSLPIGGGLPPGEAADFALSAFSNFGELLTEADALESARRALTDVYTLHPAMDACVRIVTGARRV